MTRLNKIITEAINNQVNLKGYRNNLLRTVQELSKFEARINDKNFSQVINYGSEIIRAIDRNDIGDTQRPYGRYSDYEDDGYRGLLQRSVGGVMNALSNAGFDGLTRPMQNMADDWRNGPIQRWLRDKKRHDDYIKGRNQTSQNGGDLSKMSLTELLAYKESFKKVSSAACNALYASKSQYSKIVPPKLGYMFKIIDCIYQQLYGKPVPAANTNKQQPKGTKQPTNNQS